MLTNQQIGYLLIDKPPNITSFEVVKTIKKIFQTNVVGHIGTLDPIATGLMLVLVNRQATKLAQDLVHLSKTYTTEITFGFETDTLDITGKITQKNTPTELSQFNPNNLKPILNSFLGEYIQVTPMYSSVKLKGKHLYEIARNSQAQAITLPQRIVSIYSIELLNTVSNTPKYPQITISTHVSSGTYIRALAKDIGNKLNLYATVTKLRRINLGKFSIHEARNLSSIKENDIMPITNLAELIKRLQDGQQI